MSSSLRVGAQSLGRQLGSSLGAHGSTVVYSSVHTGLQVTVPIACRTGQIQVGKKKPRVGKTNEKQHHVVIYATNNLGQNTKLQCRLAMEL